MSWIKEKQKQRLYYHLGKRPTNLNLEITWRCNLECEICPRKKGQSEELQNKDLPLYKIKYIIDKMLTIKTINLIGAGEPMLHPEFYDIMEYFKKMKIGVKYTTNGTLLTVRNIKKLPSNINRISVSIDSPNEEMYYDLRGTELKQVIKNIKNLHRLRPDIDISLQMLVMQQNLSSALGMVAKAKEVDASISLIHPICFTKDMQMNHIHQRTFQHTASKFLKDLKDYAKANDVVISMRGSEEEEHPCLSPWKHLLITIDGTIYPCCYIYEGRGNGNTFTEWYQGHKIDVPMHQYGLGNIFHSKFEESHFNELKKHLMGIKKYYQPLSEIRETIKKDKHFWYCDICLKRWRSAC